MSLLPSPLKSPVCAMLNGLVAAPGDPPPITEVPFKNQSTTCPVLALCQSTSPSPSPLKSPVPTTEKALDAEPGEPPPINVLPLSSQITNCPLVLLRQRM